MTKQKLILITNDDGFHAKGIEILTKLMTLLGEVVVFAPDGPRSGQSSALTPDLPIRFKKIEERDNVTRYSCTGTPVDCVKLALSECLNRKPDLIVSGINHGSNAAINVVYSGTMGAAIEGCTKGIPSIGFSITDHSADADFSYFEPYILSISQEVLKHGLNKGVCLNVNAPSGKILGVKAVRQSKGYWEQEFEKRKDPRNHGEYFWLVGSFKNQEPKAEDTDETALRNGYISIVPTKIDSTDYDEIEKINGWNF